MTITYFPELALFQQELKMADEAESSPSVVMVTHRNSDTGEQQQIEVLLQPDPTVLEQVDVTLHQSPTKAYNMGSRFNSWFSSRVGYEVRLVYLGPHLRTVLGNLSANSTGRNAKTSRSWIPTIAHSLAMIGIPPSNETDRITFADVAPYLIVTRESLQDVSSRLAGDVQMDITKFRPNIVLSGSAVAYDEDFWGGLEFFTSNAAKRGEHCGAVRMALTHNCTRCVSINVDYNTGKPAVGDTGTVLKKLMKDRRVDGGAKYSPVFGRYGFLETGSQAPLKLAVGDVVKVTKRNAERTKIGKMGSNHFYNRRNAKICTRVARSLAQKIDRNGSETLT